MKTRQTTTQGRVKLTELLIRVVRVSFVYVCMCVSIIASECARVCSMYECECVGVCVYVAHPF